jgi:hypothetical protein
VTRISWQECHFSWAVKLVLLSCADPGSEIRDPKENLARIQKRTWSRNRIRIRIKYLRIHNTVCDSTWSAPLILMVSEAYWKSALMTRELTAVGRWHQPNMWLRIFRHRLAQQKSIIQSWDTISEEKIHLLVLPYMTLGLIKWNVQKNISDLVSSLINCQCKAQKASKMTRR